MLAIERAASLASGSCEVDLFWHTRNHQYLALLQAAWTCAWQAHPAHQYCASLHCKCCSLPTSRLRLFTCMLLIHCKQGHGKFL